MVLEMAHKVWKRLEKAYESTTTVKDPKLYIFKDKHDKLKSLIRPSSEA
jgi:hypothetical protein